MTKIFTAKGRYPFRSKAQTICGSTFYGTVSNLFVIDNKTPAAKITAISFFAKGGTQAKGASSRTSHFLIWQQLTRKVRTSLPPHCCYQYVNRRNGIYLTRKFD